MEKQRKDNEIIFNDKIIHDITQELYDIKKKEKVE
jgi:hypothetical protein